MWNYNYTHQYELYHHGVKGMKWGVRRYQDKNGKLTSAGKKRYSDNNTAENPKEDDKKRPGLTDKQKKYIKIGATVVATALIAYGGYKLHSHIKGKNAADMMDIATGLKRKKDPLLDSLADVEADLKKVNPKFHLSRDYQMNCGNCSIASELRRRGYDVEALGNPTGMKMSHFGQFFKGLRQDSFLDVDLPDGTDGANVQKILRNSLQNTYPKGSRGTIFFPHQFGSHFFNWEVGDNGVIFTDGQNGSQVNRIFDLYKRYKNQNGIQCLRLDDLEINADRIKTVVKNVGEQISTGSEAFDTFTDIGETFVTYTM